MKNVLLSTGFMALVLLLGWPLAASAHAHMEKSDPANGAQLTTAPKKVQAWFSEKVAAEWSKMTVTDAAGKQVDTGNVSNDGDPKHLSVGLQSLPSGSYDVKLNVISGDGHRVKGSFSFTIK